MENDVIKVYYPLGLKIIGLLINLILLLTSLAMILVSIIIEDAPFAQQAVGFLFGVFLLYTSKLHSKALWHMNRTMVLSKRGIELHQRNFSEPLDWEEVGKVEELPLSFVTRVKRKDGTILLYAYNNMRNLNAFKEALKTTNT